MPQKNKLSIAPPFAVEEAVKHLGANLRTARLRRNLTIREVADKIGTGPRAVMDAEKGKISTGVGVYTALLWLFGLLESLNDVANPMTDEKGQRLASSSERERARHGRGDIDNDF